MSVSVEIFFAGQTLTREGIFTFSELPRVGERLAFHDPADPPNTPLPTEGDSEVFKVIHQVSRAGSEEAIRIIIGNVHT